MCGRGWLDPRPFFIRSLPLCLRYTRKPGLDGWVKWTGCVVVLIPYARTDCAERAQASLENTNDKERFRHCMERFRLDFLNGWPIQPPATPRTSGCISPAEAGDWYHQQLTVRPEHACAKTMEPRQPPGGFDPETHARQACVTS